ncbi:MAG: group II intron reverse transcriptase/maturase [Candidatus Omnitrophota bacterium]
MMDKSQMKRTEKFEAGSKSSGRNSREYEQGVTDITARKEASDSGTTQLMEAVVERKNMMKALQRVEKNKGAAGIDDMQVAELRTFLKGQWPEVKVSLLAGEYEPETVRRVEIPKPGGKGKRVLGIPTVLDRLIQQALHQVLSPIFDSGFSEYSYGFRPGRDAHMAVKQSQAYVTSGKRWVVDIDLEKFFDRVNHDMLMARVARKVKDKRVLLLIRRYLQAGAMKDGLTTISREGTPQGGPLSPLLSNVILDDLDKELERREHEFCRYADDFNIYVRTEKAAERVLTSITEYLEHKLKLKVNRDKSGTGRPWKEKFLGYSMTSNKEPKLKVAAESIKRLKKKLKTKFREGKGRNVKRFIEGELNPVLRGWSNYFRLGETKLVYGDIDGWIRRRLRCVLWRQWKKPRTRTKKLIVRGISKERALKSAQNGQGAWWNSGASHMNEAYPKRYFESIGLVALLDRQRQFQLAT